MAYLIFFWSRVIGNSLIFFKLLKRELFADSAYFIPSKVTAFIILLGVTVNAAPLHIVAGLLAITGFGLMVILKVAVVPEHATVLFV